MATGNQSSTVQHLQGWCIIWKEPHKSKPLGWKTLISLECVSKMWLYSTLHSCLSHPLCLITAALYPTMTAFTPSSCPSFAKHHTSVSCFPPCYLPSNGIGKSGKLSCLLFPQHFCPRAEVLFEGTLLIDFHANSARIAEKYCFEKNHQPLGANKQLGKLVC